MKPLEEMGKFKTVVVDPPWPIHMGFDGIDSLDAVLRKNHLNPVGKRGVTPGYTTMRYDVMTLEQIAALPIASVLESDALLFLWATMGTIRDGFDLLEKWGLDYQYLMTWHKPMGPKAIGRPMYNSEFVLVGRRGSVKYQDEKAFFTANSWGNPRRHSSKPVEFYDLLRRVTPGPRLDVFGRRRIAGFYSWGDEAPEGEPEPDHYQMVLG